MSYGEFLGWLISLMQQLGIHGMIQNFMLFVISVTAVAVVIRRIQ